MASSADKFRALTRALQQSVAATTVAELNNQADELVELMKSVAPVLTGTLRDSIRKEPGKNVLQVKIKAGGKATTRAEVRKGSGVPYDYSRGVEFGTQGDRAHPFFWPVYRLRKKVMRAAVRKAIYAEIKKVSAV